MKSIFLYSLFLLSINICVAQTSEEQAIVNLSKTKFRWMIELKLDSLEKVLDDRLMFVHSNGWTENKKQLIEDIKSGKLRYISINSRDIIVRLFDHTAILTGKGNFKVLLDGSELNIDLSFTEVYVEKRKKWLLASRHANRLP